MMRLFSLVVKPATIRIVLRIAASRNWPIYQLDVKNTFFSIGILMSQFIASNLLVLLTLLLQTMCVCSRSPSVVSNRHFKHGTSDSLLT